MKIRKFKVKEGEHETEVLIPETDDKSYNDYLEEAEREKTSEELKKKPPRPKPNKEEAKAYIKERLEFRNRKGKKKYY